MRDRLWRGWVESFAGSVLLLFGGVVPAIGLIGSATAGQEGLGYALRAGAGRLTEARALSGDLLRIGRGSGRGATQTEVGMEGWEGLWRIAGIWAPGPPTAESKGDPFGGVVRGVVQRLIDDRRLRWIDGRRPQGKELLVRLAVEVSEAETMDGETMDGEGDREGTAESIDLAVFLALHGLALCDRSTALDRQHGESICAAERQARGWRRGMHDGSYLARARESSTVFELEGLAPSIGPSGPGRTSGEESAESVLEAGRGEDQPEEEGSGAGADSERTWWTRPDLREYLPAVSLGPGG